MVCRRPRRQCVHRYHLSLVFDCGAPWNSLLGWANLAHPAQCERTHARVLKTGTALQPLLFSSEPLVRIESTTILYSTLQSVLHIRCCATQTWARSHVFPCVSDLLGFARLPTPIVMFADFACTTPRAPLRRLASFCQFCLKTLLLGCVPTRALPWLRPTVLLVAARSPTILSWRFGYLQCLCFPTVC